MQSASRHADDVEYGDMPSAEPKVSPQGSLSAPAGRSNPPKTKRALTFIVIAMFLWLGWLSVVQNSSRQDKNTEAEVQPEVRHDPQRVHKHFRLLASLDSRFYPAAAADTERGRARRLIFIGDVHGCEKPLSHLLDKVNLNHHTDDHVVFTGDLVAKGPSTDGVLAIARELGASSVCGNHEDAVLLKLDAHRRHHYAAAAASSPLLESPLNAQPVSDPSLQPAVSDLEPQSAMLDDSRFRTSDFTPQSKSDQDHVWLARHLSEADIAYMAAMPAILDLGGALEPFGYRRAAVVHAGLVPGVPLDEQDRYDITRMRYMDQRTLRVGQTPGEERRRDMRPWWKVWAKWSWDHRMLVVYGHNAREGARRDEWSIGLDSACVQGGDLTALVVDVERGMYLESVACRPEI